MNTAILLIAIMLAVGAASPQQEGGATLPDIDISGSANGIVTLPDHVPDVFRDVFVKYTKVFAPNGKQKKSPRKTLRIGGVSAANFSLHHGETEYGRMRRRVRSNTTGARCPPVSVTNASTVEERIDQEGWPWMTLGVGFIPQIVLRRGRNTSRRFFRAITPRPGRRRLEMV